MKRKKQLPKSLPTKFERDIPQRTMKTTVVVHGSHQTIGWSLMWRPLTTYPCVSKIAKTSSAVVHQNLSTNTLWTINKRFTTIAFQIENSSSFSATFLIRTPSDSILHISPKQQWKSSKLSLTCDLKITLRYYKLTSRTFFKAWIRTNIFRLESMHPKECLKFTGLFWDLRHSVHLTIVIFPAGFNTSGQLLYLKNGQRIRNCASLSFSYLSNNSLVNLILPFSCTRSRSV